MADADRWPLRRIINVSVAALALFLLAAVVVGGMALNNLSDARETVVGRIDPALQQALRLESALVDQETGLRGYVLGADEDVLNPYTAGVRQQNDAIRQLERLLSDMPAAESDLARVVERAEAWRTRYAQPTIADIATSPTAQPNMTVAQGTVLFDPVRDELEALDDELNAAREDATTALQSAADSANLALIGIAIAFALVITTLAVGLRRAAIRPVSRLAEEVRQVARGDFDHRVQQSGPRELRELGADVNVMRERILSDLSAAKVAHAELDSRTTDLERSNAELEQFAYIASHDLQEPLRKVASFCQLLERRYKGKLDERADQYIAFAVDGAKRMQILINDLLAFSRVGRVVRESVEVSCAAVLEQATANLADAIERTEASVEAEELPTVSAEVPLLTAVFQNLIGNALKFRGDDPPKVRITARRDGGFWEIAVADNGIGIDPEYAERIFVIFQRLHNKADYPGTGIGLAMCRKIIEYHGGTIWLDTSVESGSRFCFTLPVIDATIDRDKDSDG
ncbi:sensor histidine kinase [Actinophytocola algeriensis]|uniref:histidine kinase n=1 Tax=Actinophytocola algeriensis TaxID=1768010 RepID=A0A7W7VGU3_9PSEU|nr:sensor histidine kinase [Actinophytocola algeriensis]MBB4909703.1 signal transduction histidine kinase [Actinophytocola algeriensis]MBE1475693.1 signal transduction histidine kinase [Actinophytocola algeriensis]